MAAPFPSATGGPGSGGFTSKGWLHAVEGAFFHPGDKRVPLITAQFDGRPAWLRGTADDHGVTICRDLDTRAAVTSRPVPHQFTARSVRHVIPTTKSSPTPL